MIDAATEIGQIRTGGRGVMATSAQDLAAEGADVANLTIAAGLTPLETSRAVLGWARETFRNRMVAMSSMADEVMVDLVSEVIPGVTVAFIDTGLHFPETLETRDRMSRILDIRMLNVKPRITLEEQDAEYGPRLFERDPDACCQLRKVEPLNRTLANFDAWITGMRRAEAATRAEIGIVEHDAKRDRVKINPIAHWDDVFVAEYAERSAVFQNPLREQGYLSIGCATCTIRPVPGADPRSGRWAGTDKTECGLHRDPPRPTQ